MRGLIYTAVFLMLAFGCNTQQRTIADGAATKNDTIRIANDSLEYEVIIIDPGFNNWLVTTARPRGYHTQQYMEQRNRVWVSEWNNRARMPGRGSNDFMPIDYLSSIDYGYEVNYLLFNYLTYFQIKNNIRLGGFTPRI